MRVSPISRCGTTRTNSLSNGSSWKREPVAKRLFWKRNDRVIVTLGSMTEAYSLGSMDSPATLLGQNRWRILVSLGKACGRTNRVWPSREFCRPYRSVEVESFTTTLHDPTLFEIIRDLTGTCPEKAGSSPFPSPVGWRRLCCRISRILSDSQKMLQVLLGYGLFVDIPGNFVKKPMSACTGSEIMTEILGHLRLQDQTSSILEAAPAYRA